MLNLDKESEIIIKTLYADIDDQSALEHIMRYLHRLHKQVLDGSRIYVDLDIINIFDQSCISSIINLSEDINFMCLEARKMVKITIDGSIASNFATHSSGIYA